MGKESIWGELVANIFGQAEFTVPADLQETHVASISSELSDKTQVLPSSSASSRIFAAGELL
jgi:hypothetical protein